MKKTVFLIVMLALIGASSCNKNYNCTCESYADFSISTQTIEASSKTAAVSACNGLTNISQDCAIAAQ